MADKSRDVEVVEIVPEHFGKCSFCGSDDESMMRGPCIANLFEGEAKQYIIDALTLVGLYDPKLQKAKSAAHFLICESCTHGLSDWFMEEAIKEGSAEARARSVNMTPGRILLMLDKVVIGQERAKKALSIAVWEHYIRMRAYDSPPPLRKTADADVVIEKSNVLLIGPTGCGKTLLVQAIAQYLEVPFATLDASMVTASGYKGADASDCLKQLFYQADGDLLAAERGIIYIDEVDKIKAQESSGKDVGGVDAQQTFLKLVEGSDVNIEVTLPGGHKTEVTIDTRNILFIASGAFPGLSKQKHASTSRKGLGFGGSATKKFSGSEAIPEVAPEDLEKYGFIAEFCGRFPVIATLDALTRSDLERILVEPQNALVRQFVKLFRIAGVELVITDEVLAGVVDDALSRKTGARGLRGALEKRLQHVLFAVPDMKLRHPRLKKVIVDKACAEGGAPQCEFRPPKIKMFPVEKAQG